MRYISDSKRCFAIKTERVETPAKQHLKGSSSAGAAAAGCGTGPAPAVTVAAGAPPGRDRGERSLLMSGW